MLAVIKNPAEVRARTGFLDRSESTALSTQPNPHLRASSKAWFTVYACVFTIYASHHFAPCRPMTRGAAQHRSIKSHQFAPIEQCSIFCARPRDFAAARLRLQAKLGLFDVLGQKGLSKTQVQTNGFCYPSSSSFFALLSLFFW